MENSLDDKSEVYAPEDYDFWIKSAPWDRHIAIRLALGLFPTNTDADIQPLKEPKELVPTYKRYMELLTNSIENGMEEPISPTALVEWAKVRNLEAFPRELKKRIKFYQKLRGDAKLEFLDAREQKSLVLMLGGIIENIYRKNVRTKQRESLATEILGDLENEGIYLDRDTIYKWLVKMDEELATYFEKHPKSKIS